jgi:hypothetical protein
VRGPLWIYSTFETNGPSKLLVKLLSSSTTLNTTSNLKACLELHLKNRVFKLKRAFRQKLHFYAFAKRLLAIFRFFLPLKVLLIFLPNNYFFFSQMCFFSVKSSFCLLKCNLKQNLSLADERIPVLCPHQCFFLWVKNYTVCH